jgi:glutathione S-transferase
MLWRHYWRPNSGSLVTDVAFAWAGLNPERVRVIRGTEHNVDFLVLNPAAQVPVVAMPDGTVLTETAAILIALDEAAPEAGLLPPAGSAARAISLRWLMFLATSAYSAALRCYYCHRFTTDQSEAALAGICEAARHDARRLLAIFADTIAGPFLLGERVTIVDVYGAMLASWFEQEADFPALHAHQRALMSLPMIAEAWRRHEEGVE